MFQTCILNSH